MIDALEWSRPWALAGLVFPALLWWLARRPRPPRERATGTLSVWRELLEERRATRSRAVRGLPPRLAWVLAALALGTLALAGPRAAAREEARPLVALDLRPALFLPWSLADGDAGRRIDVALDALRDEGVRAATWTRFDGAAWERAEGDAPPDAWLRAPRVGGAPPPWSEVDRPGAWILTDRPPATLAASWIASGGRAVPGLVGRRAGSELRWTGDGLALGPAERPRPTVAVDPDAPRALAALTDAWAEERGFATGEDGADGAALRVAATAASEGEVRVRGAGWSLVARAGVPPAGRTRWRAEDGAVVLAAEPGRLALALRDPLAIEDGRDALGLAWIDALEDAVLPPEGAVPVADRRAAGETTVRIGAEAGRRSAPGPPLASTLALAALACAALGLRGAALRA